MRDDGRQGQEAEEEYLWLQQMKSAMDKKMIELMKSDEVENGTK